MAAAAGGTRHLVSLLRATLVSCAPLGLWFLEQQQLLWEVVWQQQQQLVRLPLMQPMRSGWAYCSS